MSPKQIAILVLSVETAASSYARSCLLTGKQMSIRLAFDLGTHSIGWAVFTIVDEKGQSPRSHDLLDCGVRIFDDSRDQQTERPLGEQRRGPRSARRRRDRFLQRSKHLRKLLVGARLLPEDHKARRQLAERDPYQLRVEGLDHALHPHELGRVLLHLNQRRGFKSNRKTDASDKDAEKGKIASGVERLREQMADAGARTIGEFLWLRHKGDGSGSPRKRLPTRIRMAGEGASALYEFYPSRAALEDEFDCLLANQAQFHADTLTPDLVAEIRHAIFYQRKLKTPKPGKCTLVDGETRLPKALPSVEARTIYEVVNHLRYGEGVQLDKKLTDKQRDEIADLLLSGANVTDARLRKTTGASGDARFALAGGQQRGLKDYISKSAKALSAKDAFGAAWHALSLDDKDAIVTKLIGDDDDDVVRDWLIETHGLDEAAANKVIAVKLPIGTARLGATANAAVLVELKAPDVPIYSKAVERAGKKLGMAWHHSDMDNPELRDFLPYYARILDRQVMPGTDAPGDNKDEATFGRIANPTVHRCLRQLQKLVNALIRKHGKPAQIVIEIARDLKMGEKQKGETRRTNEQNRQANDARRVKLAKLGQSDNPGNLLRLRLFEEQQRASDGVALCPFSLKPIEVNQLFTDDIEVDHLLPYSRTLDDSAANKVVCYRKYNQCKGARSPFEAFQNKENWDEIESRARALPANKRWRFAENAMQRFEDKERGFAARQLNETRYISRLAHIYLTAVAGKGNVYVTTGQLTSMLRRRWGLNAILRGGNREDDEPARKVRDDHRHHAIDAIVVGAIDRPLLQQMARTAGLWEGEGRDWRVAETAPEEPLAGFRDKAADLVRSIVVSRKPDHGKGGALHEETAYGLVLDADEAKLIGNVVRRKPVVSLTAAEIDRVRDGALREALQPAVAPFRDDKGKLTDKKGFEAALKAFSEQSGVRRVRVGKAEKDVIAIRDRNGQVYKSVAPGENHHIDIVQMRDGSWQAFTATRFDVNQKNFRPEWERTKVGGKLVMRVHKGDTIEVTDNGATRIMTVHRLSPSNNVLYLAEHMEGGALQKRHSENDDLFRWEYANIGGLKARNARLVHIDILGTVHKRPSNVA